MQVKIFLKLTRCIFGSKQRATEGYPFSGMDKVEQKEYLSSKRSLLYVAITRARQLVFIVGFGEATGLLTPNM